MMRVRASHKGLSLTAEYATALPETILADDHRLRQILINLVGNALKFTDKGSVRLINSFLPAWKDDQPALRIQISDTGIGMDPEVVSALGRPFEQADASTTRKYGGTGLGLTITRRLVDMMGAELTVQSERGKGSAFTITMPTGSLNGVKMVEAPTEAIDAPTDTATAGSAGQDLALDGLRVLLAEDGPDNQRLISELLRRAGATVDVADNGRLAVERAAAAEFDLILMDMQMPEMDGYEATGKLRAAGVRCPIVALTAHALVGDRQRCLAAGCTDYVAKPINRNRLIQMVAQRTGRRSDSDALPPTAEPPKASGGEVIRSDFTDDPEMVPLVREFAAGLPRRIAAMRQAMANSHLEELRRNAHQLKGSGGGYGYPAVTEVAAQLEQDAKAGDVESAALRLKELQRLAQAIRRGLEQAPVRQ